MRATLSAQVNRTLRGRARYSGWQASVALVVVSLAILAGPGNAKGQRSVDIGPLPPIPVPADNPMTPGKVELGKLLFFDVRLSGDLSRSCASCHDPEHGWTVRAAPSPAYPGNMERRHSMTLVNVAYNKALIWDGRAPNLERQALGPVRNPLHMNLNLGLLVERLRAVRGYVQRFRQVFGTGPSTNGIAKALAAFERTIVTAEAPFDRYVKGDKGALPPGAIRGLDLFRGKARCIACHNGPNFSDSGFHNLGVPHPPYLREPLVLVALRFDAKRMKVPEPTKLTTDPGRYLVTKHPKDWGAFKTPTLRNVVGRGPYMHNGAFKTLEEVIAFYNRGGGADANKSPLVQPLGLNAAEQKDLLEFLKALTGLLPRVRVPKLP